MRLVLIGPPGAGKGTQADILADQYRVPKVTTGDLIRQEIARDTARGRRCAVIHNGDLAPPADVRSLMVESMRQAERGVILDGAVRTVQQARDVDVILTESGVALDGVVQFTVPVDELVRRAAARTVCGLCQTPYAYMAVGAACAKCAGRLTRRLEDDPVAQRKRFAIYAEATGPVLDYYAARGTPVIEVDGLGPIATVTARVTSGLAAAGLTAAPNARVAAPALPPAIIERQSLTEKYRSARRQ